MKIVHISTYDNSGGAARAAFRLHVGLKAAGHESRMLVGYKVETSSDIDSIMMDRPPWKRMMRRAVRMLDTRVSLQYLFLPWAGEFLGHPAVQCANVINLHNAHGGYFPHRILPKLSRVAPVVWTLHDMWALTGHCAYSYDCERWKTGCRRCPYLSESPHLTIDTTVLHWRIKNWIYSRSNLTIVTPSCWLADLVRQSPLLGSFKVHHIPYGLDTSVFKPIPRPVARQALALPVAARVVLFAAPSLAKRRKGVAYLLKALWRLEQAGMDNTLLLVVGAGSALPEGSDIRYPVRHLGVIANDHLLALCYSAADVFILPTLADNLPNVILESMACGTPTVSFKVGGVLEPVRHMETGYLAVYKDAADLAKGIETLLNDSQLRAKMSRRCREIAEQEYSLNLYTKRYVQLYQEVIERQCAKTR